jgi:DNA processing protein
LRSRRVGIHTFFRLLEEHGTAGAALAALPEVARAAGVEGYAPCPAEVVAAEIRAARQAGASWLAHGRAGYPADLAELSDPPPLLALVGDAALLQRPMIALVGARNASSLGTRMARRLAEELGQAGFVVVSGLARGIDTAAHHASLATGTVAVMAGGVDVVYPVENAVLAQEIGERGLRLSEQPMHLDPQARHFPRRNRIISGLARAVVVVEAAAKSGSLITARTALDQGRDVLAVPGHPFDARAGGCNMLIRDGALLVRGASDVIEALAREPAAPARAAPSPADVPPPSRERRTLTETAALHGLILDRLGPSPVAEDQLIRDLALPVGDVAPELLSLELEGRIRRQPGGLVSLAV